MKISVRQLRAISDTLYNHLEANGHEEIELRHDFYWHIPKEDMYDLHTEPTVHDVGQLFDDWAELQELRKSDHDVIAYDLVHLTALLRYIGEQIVS